MLDALVSTLPDIPSLDRPVQRTAAEVDLGLWDAVVAGAGPAGSMAACRLAQAGRRVLLLDKASFPRLKVCGDLLAPDSLACLKEINLDSAVRRLGFEARRFRVMSPSRAVLDVEGDFVSLQRHVLDFLLAGQAVRSGAVFAHADVRDVSVDEGGMVRIRIRERPGGFSARTALLGVGAHAALLKKRNMLTRKGCNAVAARCYVRSGEDMDHFLATYDKSVLPGYAWIFPLGQGMFNMGCGVFLDGKKGKAPDLKKLFGRFVNEFPLARRIMDKAKEVSPFRGAPLRCGLEGSLPLSQRRILAMGECLGTTYPFSGEGIGKAMETGALAARVASRALAGGGLDSLEEYPRLLEERLRARYAGYAKAQQWLSRSWLNDFVIRRAGKSPALRRAASGVMNESLDPREIFSLRGLWKSLWA